VILYIDTSAAMKLLVSELETPALRAFLAERTAVDRAVASMLLHTELHCAARRHPDVVSIEAVNLVLDAISLVDIRRGDLIIAPTMPGALRSNDAIHLAVAVRLGADAVLTYDAELARAAELLGLQVATPA
jgi:predicted nucleic acid-binding protein